MSAPAGYQDELWLIEQDIASIGEAGAFSTPIDPHRVTRYVYGLYQRASIAGDLAGLSTAERAIGRALPLLAHPGDLFLLKANIALKLHRLGDAETSLLAVPSICNSNEGRLLLADLAFQQGRYREADGGYQKVLEAERSWSALARLAYLRSKLGNVTGADRLYRDAEDELTAKQMRSYAWLEVQRGFLAFAHGDYRVARDCYARAEAAYPGYWLVHEYLAELLGAEGSYRQAIDILKGISLAKCRPDLYQAIAELYEIAGQPDQADYWGQKALIGYHQSVRSGEVHFLHHFADYCTDVVKDGAEAVTWARADLQLRDNFTTQAALAWAFYRHAQFDEACTWIDRALASGAVEARLFFRAATIYTAAGDPELGRSHMEHAKRLNPCVEQFHIHH